ncbi:hypothetical protein DCAR_0520129 [Daucus carota subsp. sativus]|uniref:Protein kinase domain-containing protein n=1 Tax=Daucus carota subsp. sativus TaxID=79200 RepID=A0AAF1AZ63_DAUCS|nr:hypothetical protein DCAR_0520129 [Daucus carota subsp. sativus]
MDPHVDRFLDRVPKKKQSDHLSIREKGITYTIMEPIGTWGQDYCHIVYEAVTTTGFNDTSPRSVAFTMVKNNEGEVYEKAEKSLEKSTSVNHINILPLIAHFLKQLKYETICMVLPFDAQVLSLRSIIQSRPKYADGIPQNCIAASLLHVLRALHVIHSKGEDHSEITAANIFYHIEDKSIKLAYAASCFDRTYAPEESGEFGINKLLSWGAPPELDMVKESPLKRKYDAFAADIWFIGIAALELAYGKIKVASRNELLRIASYISNVGILPNTWEELRTEVFEAEILKYHPTRKFLKFPTDFKNPPRFDEYFGHFVAVCLDTNPKERQLADELLTGGFLGHINEEESMEIFRATMILGYKDLNKKKAIVTG